MVSFFASWCVYCNEELPGFVQVAKATAGKVAFVGVDTNDPGDGVAMAHRFDLAGAGFALAHDIGADPASDLWRSYGSQGLPVTAFYDASGRLVDFSGGMLTQDELQQRITKLFGVTASAPDAANLVAPVIPLIPQGAYELLGRNAANPAFAAIDLRPADQYARRDRRPRGGTGQGGQLLPLRRRRAGLPCGGGGPARGRLQAPLRHRGRLRRLGRRRVPDDAVRHLSARKPAPVRDARPGTRSRGRRTRTRARGR